MPYGARRAERVLRRVWGETRVVSRSAGLMNAAASRAGLVSNRGDFASMRAGLLSSHGGLASNHAGWGLSDARFASNHAGLV